MAFCWTGKIELRFFLKLPPLSYHHCGNHPFFFSNFLLGINKIVKIIHLDSNSRLQSNDINDLGIRSILRRERRLGLIS